MRREDVAGRELESEIERKHRGPVHVVAGRAAAALRPALCCAGAAAYVGAQCSVRGLGNVSDCWQPLLDHHVSVILSGPVVLWHAVSQSFSTNREFPEHIFPTAQEALNALGCTVGVLLAHEVLRHVCIWLVWYSRHTDTSWDDVLFGCGTRVLATRHPLSPH